MTNEELLADLQSFDPSEPMMATSVCRRCGFVWPRTPMTIEQLAERRELGCPVCNVLPGNMRQAHI